MVYWAQPAEEEGRAKCAALCGLGLEALSASWPLPYSYWSIPEPGTAAVFARGLQLEPRS